MTTPPGDTSLVVLSGGLNINRGCGQGKARGVTGGDKGRVLFREKAMLRKCPHALVVPALVIFSHLVAPPAPPQLPLFLPSCFLRLSWSSRRLLSCPVHFPVERALLASPAFGLARGELLGLHQGGLPPALLSPRCLVRLQHPCQGAEPVAKQQPELCPCSWRGSSSRKRSLC